MNDRHQEAALHLQSVEPGFKPIIEVVGVLSLEPQDLTLFQALSKTIIYQQLAGAAASSIHQKFCALFTKDTPQPKAAIEKGIETLQTAGLSRTKAATITRVAEAVVQKALPGDSAIKTMGDAEIAACLTEIKGIGPWTANVAMMTWLARPNIYPVNDLGLRKGVMRLYGLDELPDADSMQARAEAWQPYRSYASLYLWRSLEI